MLETLFSVGPIVFSYFERGSEYTSIGTACTSLQFLHSNITYSYTRRPAELHLNLE
jgi:hypothetical protein